MRTVYRLRMTASVACGGVIIVIVRLNSGGFVKIYSFHTFVGQAADGACGRDVRPDGDRVAEVVACFLCPGIVIDLLHVVMRICIAAARADAGTVGEMGTIQFVTTVD